jgi:SOS-response transcriptional repressor LexA
MHEREALVLGVTRDFFAQHGYAPTLMEIGARANLSANTVAQYIARLEIRGFIKKGPRGHRNLQLVNKEPEAA